MKCPRTGKDMIEIKVKGVTLDVSTGCGGIWFDQFEFKKFDEPTEADGEELIKASEKYYKPGLDLQTRLACPRHPDVTMLRNFFSIKREVQIDQCPECGGVWLDAEELKKIRALFPSEAAANEAAAKHFQDMFAARISADKIKDEAKLKGAQKFAGVFKFLCPSYHIPGEQNWGAH